MQANLILSSTHTKVHHNLYYTFFNKLLSKITLTLKIADQMHDSNRHSQPFLVTLHFGYQKFDKTFMTGDWLSKVTWWIYLHSCCEKRERWQDRELILKKTLYATHILRNSGTITHGCERNLRNCFYTALILRSGLTVQ